MTRERGSGGFGGRSAGPQSHENAQNCRPTRPSSRTSSRPGRTPRSRSARRRCCFPARRAVAAAEAVMSAAARCDLLGVTPGTVEIRAIGVERRGEWAATYIYAQSGPRRSHGGSRVCRSTAARIGCIPAGLPHHAFGVGPLVISEVELDESGHTVLIALDSRTPARRVSGSRSRRGGSSPLPWTTPGSPRVHEATDGRRARGRDGRLNQGEPA